MRYFIDTEFSERGPRFPIQLISIGVVAEDGREFYACNKDFNPKHANPWVRKNVLPLLPDPKPERVEWGGSPRLNAEAAAWMRAKRIGDGIYDFVDDGPEFWGYYSDYDWVALCQLFGDMSMLPTGWPYYCRDLRQWLDGRGLQDVSQPDDAPHNALQDARWIRETFLTYSRHAEVV